MGHVMQSSADNIRILNVLYYHFLRCWEWVAIADFADDTHEHDPHTHNTLTQQRFKCPFAPLAMHAEPQRWMMATFVMMAMMTNE